MEKFPVHSTKEEARMAMAREGLRAEEADDWTGLPHPDRNTVVDKLQVARASTTEELGSPNVYEAARRLWRLLYDREGAARIVGEEGLEKYPDRRDIVSRRLELMPKSIPSEEEFAQAVRYVMTNKVDFGACLSPEAREQFEWVLRRTYTSLIWTDGDEQGVPERGLPGSREQLKKLAAARFYNRLRRDIATERGVDRGEALSVAAIEGKMDLIPEIAARLVERGVQRVVIVEDRLKNLIWAEDSIRLQAPSLEVFPVWVRVGIYRDEFDKEMGPDESVRWSHAIDDIGQLSQMLEEYAVLEEGIKVAAIFDLDGPLHDDEMRKKLQTQAVMRELLERGWIGMTEDMEKMKNGGIE
jgi:hypothetical protein